VLHHSLQVPVGDGYIEPVYRAGNDPDQHLVLAWRADGQVVQAWRSTEVVDGDGFHRMLLPAGQQVTDPDIVQVRTGRYRPDEVSLGDDSDRPAGPLAVQDDKGGRVGMLDQVGRRRRVIVEVNHRHRCGCCHARLSFRLNCSRLGRL